MKSVSAAAVVTSVSSWCYQESLPELPLFCTLMARIISPGSIPRKMRFQHGPHISHQFYEIPCKGSSLGKTFRKQCLLHGLIFSLSPFSRVPLESQQFITEVQAEWLEPMQSQLNILVPALYTVTIISSLYIERKTILAY